MQVALVEGQQTEPPRGNHETIGVIGRFGDPETFFPQGTALSECTQFGMAPGKPGTGDHGGDENLPKPPINPHPPARRHVTPPTGHPPVTDPRRAPATAAV